MTTDANRPGVLRERQATRKRLNKDNLSQTAEVKTRLGTLRAFFQQRLRQVTENLQPIYTQMLEQVDRLLALEQEDENRQKLEGFTRSVGPDERVR